MRRTPVEAYYAQRREKLFEIGPKDAAWVFFSPPTMRRNDDVDHPFRQDSHYYYTTGFEEANTVSIFIYNQNKKQVEWHMFLAPRDPKMELWEGEMYGLERVGDLFGVDKAYAISDFEKEAPAIIKNASQIYYRLGNYPQQDLIFHKVVGRSVRLNGRTGRAYPAIVDPQTVIGQMRLIKSSEEIELLRKAGQASAFAHKEIIRTIEPGMNEREVSGRIDFLFQQQGCMRNGYPSIVASGKNATCLHYSSNNQECKNGDLMLLDAGGEYGYYTADITRTYPVGRSFSKEQEALYDIVLQAQKECVQAVKPGATFPALQAKAIDLLTQGMMDLGLVKGDKDIFIQEKKYTSFYPHNLGHWLGVDVHDVGLYYEGDHPVPFKEGMVLTIEPGIYIQPDDETFPAEYRGIGIRIEDDVLVTKNGCEVLTQDVPKEKDEILALRKA